MQQGVVGLLKETLKEWSEDDAPRVAASLAFYTLLSLAPLVLLTIAIVGFALGQSSAQEHIVREVQMVLGPQAGEVVDAVIKGAESEEAGVISTVIGLLVLLFGASGVFGELQSALNTVWGVKLKQGRSWMDLARERVFSFAMVIAVAFLLLASLILSAFLSGAGHFMEGALPGGEPVWQVINFIASLGVVTLLFAFIFKVVPDVEIEWRDVWVGAVVSAVLFTIGKQLLGLYLGTSTVASSYGAAGSVVAMVVWVYYSSQLVFFGAELALVRARQLGRPLLPSKHATYADGSGAVGNRSATGTFSVTF